MAVVDGVVCRAVEPSLKNFPLYTTVEVLGRSAQQLNGFPGVSSRTRTCNNGEYRGEEAVNGDNDSPGRR